MRRLPVLSLVLLLASAPWPALRAQEAPREARVRAKIVGDRIAVRCQLTSHASTMPAYLFFAYDRLCGVELHNKAAEALEIEKDGQRRPFTLGFPGLEIAVDKREHGDEDALNEFTKLHSPELEEIAVVGTIGANLLMDYHVRFDLAHETITISTPREESEAKPEGPEARYVRAYATTKLVWLPVRLRGDLTRVVGIGGEQYDSIVDHILCEELEAPGGTIGSVELGGAVADGGFDLSTIVAWRPEELPYAHEEGALGILGINFLKEFRIEIDRVNGWVGLTRVQDSGFPTEERDFFVARASGDIAPLHRWLEQHADTRLGGLAADRLLQLHVDYGSPAAQIEAAVGWVDRTRPEALRATRAIDTMQLLMQARLPEAAVVAGRLGVRAGRLDRYPESVHRLHVRLGEVLLDLGQNRAAWEHLMSAAFGLNEAVGAADQARVNLLLGTCYEREERYRRAASRYVQAVITPEAGEAAIAGLTRVQEELDDGEFSFRLVDRLIAGKVRGMTAPTVFEADAETDTNRTVLVEHLTNPHLGVKRGELWRAWTEGGAMVFQGIQTHFPRERVVLLGYHGTKPRPVGITNALALRAEERLRGRPAFCVDGRPVMTGALEYHDADKGYSELRAAVRRALTRPSRYEIAAEAKLVDGRVQGRVRVRGPEAPDVWVEVILAEKGVLYPGLGATVVHRMVARASLTADREGLAFVPDDLTPEGDPLLTVPFDRALADVEAENRRFLDALEERLQSIATRLSVGMDPNELAVVVCLRDDRTGEVLQATQTDVRAGEN